MTRAGESESRAARRRREALIRASRVESRVESRLGRRRRVVARRASSSERRWSSSFLRLNDDEDAHEADEREARAARVRRREDDRAKERVETETRRGLAR